MMGGEQRRDEPGKEIEKKMRAGKRIDKQYKKEGKQ
jgi:hypothetical protein